MYYEKELQALKKANRYRSRSVVDYTIKDFASNDYLNLASNKEALTKAYEALSQNKVYASKASMLVNGYHQIHKDFEALLCKVNGFEEAIILGSGFNANIALIEALTRKKDRLFLDEEYHASGILASQLQHIDVSFFRHNDASHLKELLHQSKAKRNIVAIEGIYSMSGEMAKKEIFDVVQEFKENTLLIVDEAHSSGVLGANLSGIFSHYNLDIEPNYIKMGTLGKAYGSFGAYILSSKHIAAYLINRAKPIIYATALSLFDTLMAHYNLEYILEHKEVLKAKINANKALAKEILDISIDGLILPIVINDNKKVVAIKEALLEQGFEIGAIREPTVEQAILRVILRLEHSETTTKELLELIKRYKKN